MSIDTTHLRELALTHESDHIHTSAELIRAAQEIDQLRTQLLLWKNGCVFKSTCYLAAAINELSK